MRQFVTFCPGFFDFSGFCTMAKTVLKQNSSNSILDQLEATNLSCDLTWPTSPWHFLLWANNNQTTLDTVGHTTHLDGYNSAKIIKKICLIVARKIQNPLVFLAQNFFNIHCISAVLSPADVYTHITIRNTSKKTISIKLSGSRLSKRLPWWEPFFTTRLRTLLYRTGVRKHSLLKIKK